MRDEIRPFVNDARPLVRDLRPAVEDLDGSAPDVALDVGILNRFFNMLAFNPDGREEPGSPTRQEGYLFHLALARAPGRAPVLDVGRPRRRSARSRSASRAT